MQTDNLPIYITARMGSTRLPEKHLLPMLGVKISIECLIERLEHADLPIILCTGKESSDLPLIEAVEHLGIDVFTGDSDNVLLRYSQAMSAMAHDAAVIVDGDDLFVSVDVIRTVSKIYKDHDIIECTDYPYGGVPFLISHKMIKNLSDANVTPHGWSRFLADMPGKRETLQSPGFGSVADNLRLTLDYPEDLAFLQHLFANIKNKKFIDLVDVAEYVEQNYSKLKEAFPDLFNGEIAAKAKAHLS